MATTQLGFLPRQGLGEPSPIPCDASTNRPMREGFTFQVRHVITGHCVFLGAFFETETKPMPTFAKIACSAPPNTPPSVPVTCPQQVYWGIGAPTIVPATSAAIYFDVSNPIQPGVWNYSQGAWNQFIG